MCDPKLSYYRPSKLIVKNLILCLSFVFVCLLLFLFCFVFFRRRPLDVHTHDPVWLAAHVLRSRRRQHLLPGEFWGVLQTAPALDAFHAGEPGPAHQPVESHACQQRVHVVILHDLSGVFGAVNNHRVRTYTCVWWTGVTAELRFSVVRSPWFWVSGYCTKWRIQGQFSYCSSSSRSLNVQTQPRNSILNLDTYWWL